MTSERWRNNWPDWQACLKIISRSRQCILEVNHHRQINRSLDHSSRLRVICHIELIAPTCDNQGLQLHRPLGQHLDPLICQTPQEANLMDKSLRRTNHDGTPFPSLTPSYSQSWYEVATSSQLSLHLSDPHFQDGTMPTLDATTTVGIQVIPRKIAPHSNLRSKSWSMMGNWHLKIWMGSWSQRSV